MERTPFGLLVPAYVYPSAGKWDGLLSVGRKLQKGLITVANVDDGPGPPTADLDYVKGVRAVHDRCALVIGYVTDSYGTHETVCADIDRWFNTYKMDGIFIDEVSDTNEERATTLVGKVRDGHPRRVVVLNPGVIPSYAFIEATDPAIVVIQEEAAAEYEAGWPPAGWVRDRAGSNNAIPADRLAITAHSAPTDSNLQALPGLAATYRIGWVYVQHSPGPIYNSFSIWLPTLGSHLQCARESSIPRYFACRALGGLLCFASQTLARVTRRKRA